MFKAAIFDLDGTLVDSMPDISLAANMALEHLGLRTFSTNEIKTVAGGGHWRLLRRAITWAQDGIPPTDEDLARAVAIKKRQEAGPTGHDQTKPYAGVHGLLRTLQEDGVQLAILSNTAESSVREVVAKFFPDINFRHVAGAREDTPLKPDPTAVFRIMEKHFDHDVTPADVIFVGDTENDMKVANTAGCTPIAVSWGCRTPEQLFGAGAAHCVDTAEDIVSFMLNPPTTAENAF